MFDFAEKLREMAANIPDGDAPALRNAHARAVRAAEIVTAALDIDPTLREHGLRDLDLCAEILRQLRPLARQAAQFLEHQRLTEAGAPTREIARIGKVREGAPAEVEDLSARAVEIAERISAAALPDWDTPVRIRERSERRRPARRRSPARH